MDNDLRKLIEDNNKLLSENLALTRQNAKKIKRIQSHIRRTMIVKSLYWIIIIIVTFGAWYFSKPYINNAVKTYGEIKQNLDKTTDFVNNPGSLFKDANLVEQIFGS